MLAHLRFKITALSRPGGFPSPMPHRAPAAPPLQHGTCSNTLQRAPSRRRDRARSSAAHGRSPVVLKEGGGKGDEMIASSTLARPFGAAPSDAALRLCVDLPDRFGTSEAPAGSRTSPLRRPPVGVSPRLHIPEGRGMLVPPDGRHVGMALPPGRPNMPLIAAICLTGGYSTTPRRLIALYGHPRVRRCTTHISLGM